MSNNEEFLWNQFCRLGEMISDGLHYEPDGKWISREYKRLSRILIPEIKEMEKARRKLKAEKTDEKVKLFIVDKFCECGGKLEQRRSGTKVLYCKLCNTRYRINSRKQK